MLTTRTARWVFGTTILCVALLGLSWLLLLSPTRTEAAELRDRNASTQSQNDLLEVRIAQLRAQFAGLPERQAELAAILAQMPPDAGMPQLVRDLDTMAKSTGVTLSSVTPGAGQILPVGSAATAAPAAAAPAMAAPAVAAADTAAAGTPEAATAQGGMVVAIPVTLAIEGDYFQTVAFLKQLQTQMPRAFLVTGVQMAAGSANGTTAAGTGSSVAVTVTGKVFALPGLSTDVLTPATDRTAGAPGSPMSTPTPTSTTIPSMTPSMTPSTTPTVTSTLEVS